MLLGAIIYLIVSVIILIIGILNLKGNISMVHSYHIENIKPEDKLKFAKLMGIGMVIIGVSFFIAGIAMILSNVFTNDLFMIINIVVTIVGFIIGMIICIYSIKKYNKTIF